ncbi:VirB4 family type IV secretion system protein [uncultured Oscillibacter sp.]|uniref:VirB4 family type IV secretion system protein n=1 Tax=uncultured Oscillibacter sp. TaxID=876091 RepID=UPI00262DB37C|nr:ATP-binding protein [uncultured Oscillibacter sp.]
MRQEERDTYLIPPNFIEGGTLLGGMFKTRNVIEAGILGALTAVPVMHLALSLTMRIIILCLTTLPLVLLALIGVGGGSLSEFILQFFNYLRNRRILGKNGESKKSLLPSWAQRPAQPKMEDAEEQPKSRHRLQVDIKARKVDQFKTFLPPEVKPLNPLADYVPVEKIQNGVIYTRDHRYVKVLEVIPVNFLLRSAQEQRNIIYSFISYLKIAPVKVQFKVLTKRADIDRHVQTVRRELAQETNAHCRELQEDYLRLIRRLGSREAITRRFFLIFEHEPLPGTKRGHEEDEAIASLQTAARTAANYLRQCGNTVVLNHEDENEATAEILYHVLCRQESNDKPFAEKIKRVAAEYMAAGRSMEDIPVNEFYAPNHIDLSHGRHICIDGVYYAYLLVPAGGYKTQVPAGWLSLLVNAGDGIDLDMFLTRQPKDRMIRKLGQQLRINRSKIKETSDTNTDFDDLDGAIRSGYLLKDGLSNNEDFYYLNLLVTITAANVEDLEWKCAEMKKLLLSQDMDVQTCSFCQEQAFLSSLPLVALEKHLFERSKRNVLTLGAASCYPFTSYEMCDDNGILLGVNKHNNSLIIVDIFDSRVYKNANIAILGTSGAGKSFTMQLMATRMRRKGIQVFIVAPLKGHEFHRACSNIGGEFIQISPASKNCINVMEIRKVDKSVDELLDGPGVEKSLLAAKIQRLHIFFSLLIPDMTHEERQLLDDALIRTYAKLGITHENSTLDDPDDPGRYRTMPVLGDLYEVLKESQETKRLANIINRLVHGSARTFNQQTNVSLDNKYTVLDISELTGDLLTVGMFMALDYVWDKAKENRTEEKAIYIDECWQLIGANSNRLAAEFVLEIFKIIRGYGGSAICATQDINDFFALEDGKYGKGIINNVKTKILLNLEDEEARRVQSILHLSEAEVMEITHFERGSGLISTNNNNVTVEIKCSQMEKELITTDRRELQELLDKTQAAPVA